LRPASISPPRAPEPGDRSEPEFHNLLMTLSELAPHFPDQLRRGSWLNAYLIGVGMNQITEDYIHRDPLFLGAIGEHLLVDGGRARSIAGGWAESVAALVQETRIHRRSSRAPLAWQQSLGTLVEALADVVAEVVVPGRRDIAGMIDAAEAIASSAASLPVALRGEVLRLPSCFHAFDLEPDDIRELAARFSCFRPARSRPLLVVGVRTSGSYMAPLCAAFLKEAGYRDVHVLTLRPGHQLFARERAIVRALGRNGGLALIIDDPPGSGRTVSKIAIDLRQLSLPQSSIVLLLPLFGSPERLPEALRRYPSVLLPSEDWAVRSKLTPEAVARALRRLLAGDGQVHDVRRLPLPPRRWQRAHERALFRVELEHGDRARASSILAESVGAGYYGEHALAIARALCGHVPEIYGLDQGCLYREWLAEERRAGASTPGEHQALVAAVTNYVVDRSRALRAAHDASRRLAGQRPVWEVVSHILSRPFGRAAPAARLLFVDALSRHLLKVARPSVVDGRTSLSSWFADGRKPNRYVKTEFTEHSFWNLGLYCYDPIFDLAGAAVSSGDPATAVELRSAYERVTGEPVAEERWLLYKLAQLWGRERIRPGEESELRRACSRASQSYIARLYLDDLEPSADGPLCAIDVDGVLETQTLGFPATTAAGAQALRALIAHGYRPILVSGRSSGEVADRCLAYRLAGGVAEYGAVVLTFAPRQDHVLVPEADLLVLARLRGALSDLKDVGIDGAYRHVVRAFRTDRLGGRRALEPRDVTAALVSTADSDRLQVIRGSAQTDFAVAHVDKGTGVQALARRIARQRTRDGEELALAVGDTAADLSMLRRATLAFAPANASSTLRHEGTSTRVLRAPYQAGLSLAVERLIGHAPGTCPTCRPRPLTREADLLLSVISAQERGWLGLSRRFLRLHAATREALQTNPAV
jgi:3-deoxy-D-manno-octulosonate 8-phosphate phosphatase KdsC-like HAD superfamily phosphatase